MEDFAHAVGGSEVRFNHGLAVQEAAPSIKQAVRALKAAIPRADDGEAADVFGGLFTRLVNQRQYTEGHHPVRVTLSDEEVNHLRLAHRIAAEHADGDIAERFHQNREAIDGAVAHAPA